MISTSEKSFQLNFWHKSYRWLSFHNFLNYFDIFFQISFAFHYVEN